MSAAGNPRSKQRGFSYVMLLLAVALLGIAVGTAVPLASRAKRADQEAELLYRGIAYHKAIRSYYRLHGAYPRSLDDLVSDNRRPGRRHLRTRYADPFSKPDAEQGGWTLVRHTDGGIRGVASGSRETPLKQTGFPKGFERFQNALSYSEWIFDSPPELVPVQPVVKK